MKQMQLRNSVAERALLLLARRRIESGDQEEFAEVVGNISDWDEFVTSLQWHKLEGLAYRHLVQHSLLDLIPKSSQVQLKGLYMRNVACRIQFKNELERVLAVLNGHGIPVVVMKGGALAEIVYDDPGVRPMSDLDLLVPLDRSEEAWSAVRSLGYHVTVDEAEQRRMQVIDRQLAMLVHDTKSIIVEIHTHLVEAESPMRFDIETFWDGTAEVELGNTQTLTFAPEYQVANQCLNFFKDRDLFSYSALGQLCDVAEVIRVNQDEMDWDVFGSNGPLAKLTGPIFCGLYLARHLLDAPVPDGVLDRVSPSGFKPDDAGRLVLNRVFGDQFAMKQIVSPTQEYGKLRLLKGMIFRVFEGREAIAARYGVPVGSKRVYFLYFRRLVEALRIGAVMAGNPRTAINDVATNRWLHSLQYTEGIHPDTDRSETKKVGI